MFRAPLLTALLSLAAPTLALADPCDTLEPGKRLGERFAIGVALAAPDAVEPDALPGWHRPKDPAGKAVRLRFDANKKLIEFEAPLPKCVALGKRTVTLGDPRALAAALGTCGVEQHNEGGTIIQCHGVSLTLGAAPTIRVAAATGAAAAGCTAYADGARWIDGAGPHSGELAITGPAALCGHGPAPLTAATTLQAFEKLGLRCTKETPRGGTHLTCDGVRYSFAGPPQLLASVTFAPAPAKN